MLPSANAEPPHFPQAGSLIDLTIPADLFPLGVPAVIAGMRQLTRLELNGTRCQVHSGAPSSELKLSWRTMTYAIRSLPALRQLVLCPGVSNTRDVVQLATGVLGRVRSSSVHAAELWFVASQIERTVRLSGLPGLQTCSLIMQATMASEEVLLLPETFACQSSLTELRYASHVAAADAHGPTTRLTLAPGTFVGFRSLRCVVIERAGLEAVPEALLALCDCLEVRHQGVSMTIAAVASLTRHQGPAFLSWSGHCGSVGMAVFVH